MHQALTVCIVLHGQHFLSILRAMKAICIIYNYRQYFLLYLLKCKDNAFFLCNCTRVQFCFDRWITNMLHFYDFSFIIDTDIVYHISKNTIIKCIFAIFWQEIQGFICACDFSHSSISLTHVFGYQGIVIRSST